MFAHRLVAIAAVAIMFGQLAVVLHDALAHHGEETACEVCIVKDRIADGVVAHVATPVALFAVFLTCSLAAQLIAARRIQAVRPRGPPVL